MTQGRVGPRQVGRRRQAVDGAHGRPQLLDPLPQTGAEQLVVGNQLVGQDVAHLVGDLHHVHVELVLDESTGKLQAFVLDGEMENFVRSSSPPIVVTATVDGTPRDVALAAVPNPETGETGGDTSLFEGQADWLKTTPRVDAVLKGVVVRGTAYGDVKFNFPKGNDKGS